jgi:hypothetical protein
MDGGMDEMSVRLKPTDDGMNEMFVWLDNGTNSGEVLDYLLWKTS